MLARTPSFVTPKHTLPHHTLTPCSHPPVTGRHTHPSHPCTSSPVTRTRTHPLHARSPSTVTHTRIHFRHSRRPRTQHAHARMHTPLTPTHAFSRHVHAFILLFVILTHIRPSHTGTLIYSPRAITKTKHRIDGSYVFSPVSGYFGEQWYPSRCPRVFKTIGNPPGIQRWNGKYK